MALASACRLLVTLITFGLWFSVLHERFPRGTRVGTSVSIDLTRFQLQELGQWIIAWQPSPCRQLYEAPDPSSAIISQFVDSLGSTREDNVLIVCLWRPSTPPWQVLSMILALMRNLITSNIMLCKYYLWDFVMPLSVPIGMSVHQGDVVKCQVMYKDRLDRSSIA